MSVRADAARTEADMDQQTALVADKYAAQQLAKLPQLQSLGDILANLSEDQEEQIASAIAAGEALMLLQILQVIVREYYVDQALESLPQLDDDQINI